MVLPAVSVFFCLCFVDAVMYFPNLALDIVANIFQDFPHGFCSSADSGFAALEGMIRGYFSEDFDWEGNLENPGSIAKFLVDAVGAFGFTSSNANDFLHVKVCTESLYERLKM